MGRENRNADRRRILPRRSEADATNVAQLIGALPRLNESERVLLGAALASLCPSAAPAETYASAPLYGPLRAGLAHYGVTVPPEGVLRNGTFGGAWKSAQRGAEDVLRRYVGNVARNEQTRVLSIIVRSAIAQLRRAGVPVAVRTVLQAVAASESVMDAEFPGYLRSGFFASALKQRPK